ncbi:hypothetical protein ABW20_dc0103439 [Dactylellina cionopaga]|nr:hypothetical protein ABW20_dc0103439 [Dactylellina cionopaga]
MKKGIMLALAGALIPRIAHAQLDQIPTCALVCAITIIGSSGCNQTDAACICTAIPFLIEVELCMRTACTIAEYAQTVAAAAVFCADVGVSPLPNLSSTTTTTTTATTTTTTTTTTTPTTTTTTTTTTIPSTTPTTTTETTPTTTTETTTSSSTTATTSDTTTTSTTISSTTSSSTTESTTTTTTTTYSTATTTSSEFSFVYALMPLTLMLISPYNNYNNYLFDKKFHNYYDDNHNHPVVYSRSNVEYSVDHYFFDNVSYDIDVLYDRLKLFINDH